ncbi:hypothetical protein JTB14_033896 [Gonioctena quinquepunctata]|nr:hypothetical protein JTB14_033896 [Gonioctena quinquepunctata]
MDQEEDKENQFVSNEGQGLLDSTAINRTDIESMPGTSSAAQQQLHKDHSFLISPKDIRPLPTKQTMSKKKGGRKKGSTAVLTSSPYKNMLEEEKKKQEEALEAKRLRLDKKKGQEGNQIKGKFKPSSKSSDRKSKGKQKLKRTVIVDQDSSEDDEEVNDKECIFCDESYSNSLSGEGWIRCSVCFNWAHDKCVGVEDDDPDEFICDLCAQKSHFEKN